MLGELVFLVSEGLKGRDGLEWLGIFLGNISHGSHSG
jgi:hypothetical protein